LKFKSLDKAYKKFFWFWNDIKWILYKRSVSDSNADSLEEITIGITTFMERFESCFKPLLKKLVVLFPDTEIIVTANGHYRKKEQLKYISIIREHCNKYSNVRSIFFTEPQGLSLLWNIVISRASTSKILLLNDDINICLGFKKFILTSGIANMNIATINKTWSHFFINKQITDKIGLFDEKLQEIGGEDDDFSARLAIAGIKLDNFNTNTITSKNRKRLKRIKINSYGRVMDLQRGGYSTLNTEYLESKWIMSESYFEGSTFVPNRKFKYWKLRK